MKRYSRYLAEEAEEALKYAIKLVKEDLLEKDHLDCEEEMAHLGRLIKMKKAFKKRKEFIVL